MASDTPEGDKRQHPREQVMRRGVLVHGPTARSFTCTIVDVSLGGARLQLFAPDVPETGLTLVDAEQGSVHELRAVWRTEGFLGVAFVASVDLR